MPPTNLITSATPSGVIFPYAGTTAPNGWLLCDGKSYSQSTYARLYAAIGTAYGSSGSSFNVPDLRGTFLRGTPNLSNKTLGTVYTGVDDFITITNHGYNRSGIPVRFTGTVPTGLNTTATWYTIYINDNTLAFASTEAAAIAGTRQNLSTTSTGGTMTQYIDPDASTRTAMTGGGNTGTSVGSVQDDAFESHTHTVQAGSSDAAGSITADGTTFNYNVTSGSTGGNETRPKNIYVNYIIKI